MADQVYLLDRVRVATTTGGTGALAAGASPQGWLSPAAAGAVSGRSYTWICESEDGATWEEFEGVYAAGSPATISRDLIFRNSAGTQAAINWSAGTTKRITCVAVSPRLPYLGKDGLLPNAMMAQALICQLGSTVARSIPHATGTTFNFDTLGANSLGGASGPAGSYNGVVLPVGGAYSVEANVVFASNGVGIRNLSLVINNTFPLAIDQKVAAGLGQVSLRGSWRGGLNANDTLSVQVSQDSGGALVAGGGLTTNMTVVRL
jgi:hypothetical protein